MRWLELLAVVSIAIPASEGAACQCKRNPPVYIALERADAVFIGRVLAEVRGPTKNASVTYRFEVHTGIKGVDSGLVSVSTSKFQGDCGARFTVGAVYIVYADFLPQAGVWWTDRCSRNAATEAAGEDVAALSAPVCPATLEYDADAP